MDDTPTWPKEALETTNKLASKEAETMTRPEPAETVTSHAKFSVNGTTNVNLPMPNATIAKTSSEHRKPAATATTQATPSSDMNIERKLKNGPYRIKLAEIATFEYNGSGSGEEKEFLEAKPSATNSETRVGTTTVDSVLETSQLNRKEGHAVGGLEALTSNTQQKKQQTGIQQELGQQAQQTAATKLQKQQQELKKQQQAKLVKQKAQQASGEQELEQHKQPKPAIQLSRGQQQQQQQKYQASNKDMDIGQVQQQQQQQQKHTHDHDTYTNPANTKQASAQPTPPALNIVDLYPMKMEDFNPIIRDSNAKLLKERTIYKPTASDEAAEEQEQRHAEDGYGGVDSATSDGLMKSSVGHQQNLLPNEVNTADSIIRRHYDNINNLAAAQQHSVNRRPIMPVTEEGASGAESITNSHQQRKQQKLWKPDAISDFTGKLLAEQDGVITEIEQKFRLNEFTATEQPTITTTAKDIKQVEAPQASAVNKLSHSVNHKIQPSKSLKSKYNKESVTHLPPTQKHDFIERRVKKSFDFPMHRTASASDTLGMPHVDFANTKFNTGSGATQSLSPTTLSDRGGALGVRTALGTHPEFSTTKFYNSKELYNEMMSHNRQRLKAKAKMEQGTASAVAAAARTLAVTGVETTMAATNTASNGVASAASRFAFSQNSKLETSKQAPTKAAVRQAIMGEMNMNSQRIARVNSGGASMRTVELKGDEVSLTNARAEEGQSHLTAKSNVEGGISNFVGVERQDSASVQHGYQHTNVQLSKQSTATITNNQTSTAETPSNTAILGAKTTKKYHKELQRAKLLLKSLLLPTTNDNVGAGANKSSDAGATMSTTKTTTTLKPNSNSQTNLHAPPTVRGELDKNASAPSRVDLVASAKTFDIMSLRASKSRQVATPTIATSAAVGNIDSTIDSDMTAAGTEAEGLQVKLGNSAGSDLVHVKRAKPPQTTATTSKLEKTTTRTTSSAETSISTKNPTPATSTVTNPTVDPSTNIPLIYPYPQMPRQVTMLITQPHDTTATVSSAKSSSSSSSGSAHTSYTTSTAASPTTGSTNLLTKSASKPIVRPRILSPLQEKINSLECEVQNVPSDSHLWRGNETHELLLPIVVSMSATQLPL
ncbi:unnamed protein product [Ceratitis capitata]|uniref:(Mediterranean fruit fly) hypothetical protein n=1 Tax=Ceratitis capitata TaxID=7213 RepID=A0A811UNE7_CERCA|nr:unnamed protein product [Ceratitis capitata]